MDQTHLLLQETSPGSGSSLTSKEKTPTCRCQQTNRSFCVAAELVPFNVPSAPRWEPSDVNCLGRLSEVFCWEDVFA